MILYKLTPSFTLEPLSVDHEDATLAELMACEVSPGLTVRTLLESGQGVLIQKVWLLPERVTTSGEIRYSTELAWSHWSDEYAPRTEFHIVARDPEIEVTEESPDANVVKKSLHVEIIRGNERKMQDPPRMILTKYGPMLSSDLEERWPRPGRQEFWKASQTAFSEEQLQDKENYEKRVLVDGGVMYMELVHGSQIAQSS